MSNVLLSIIDLKRLLFFYISIVPIVPIMSKLKQIQQKHETLTLQMQFFCLDPQYQIFQEICESKRLIKAGKHADIWKLAVLDTYADKWLEEGYMDRDNANLDEMDELTKKFETEKNKLLKRVQEKPTNSNIDQLWYLFFATGKAGLLVHIYKAMGNSSANERLQNNMADMYIQFTMEYRKKIQEIEINPSFVRQHQIGALHFHDLISNFKSIMKVLDAKQSQTPASSTTLSTSSQLERIDLK